MRGASKLGARLLFGVEEAWFLFLLPEHIDRMLACLWKHSSDLRVPVDIAELRRFGEIAAADQNLKVAYVFDYRSLASRLTRRCSQRAAQ